MSFKDEVIGVLALGRKESGEFFSAADRDFLIALANQGALSIANALSYQEIQILNASLEQKVADRTQELAHSNRELHNSLEQLEQTYQDLQRSQDNLLRAERMAALGRLTAGIAHEMNTPLGATLTTLKLMERLVTERRLMTTQPDKVRRSPQEIDDELE
jgi:C4-dicarboxylate-specific signal transduction histidine kinase